MPRDGAENDRTERPLLRPPIAEPLGAENDRGTDLDGGENDLDSVLLDLEPIALRGWMEGADLVQGDGDVRDGA
ncbi:MAG TPA: hypothetical protein QGG47_14940 [Acidobacteriota bacterium]|nr:hypothetical protein [Acidobacteriota bacterium]